MLARPRLAHTGKRPWNPLLLAAALIIVALAVVPSSLISRSLITFAMGIQANPMTQFAGITLSTAVITSAMARIAETFADRLSPAAHKPAATAPPLPLYLPTWGGLSVGALIASLSNDVHSRDRNGAGGDYYSDGGCDYADQVMKLRLHRIERPTPTQSWPAVCR
jgi:uncharacterized membrane protein YoaK (UPF0700 family)